MARTADFTPNIQVPQQAIIDVEGRSPLAEGLRGFIGGAAQGLSANEAIRKLRNRKKLSKLLADQPGLFGSEPIPPEIAEALAESPEAVAKQFISQREDQLKVLQEKRRAEAVARLFGATGRGGEILNPTGSAPAGPSPAPIIGAAPVAPVAPGSPATPMGAPPGSVPPVGQSPIDPEDIALAFAGEKPTEIAKFFKEEQERKSGASPQANQLRQQFIGVSAPFRQIAESFQRVADSAKDPSPAGDLALIFNYMKILDPGSVVREGEFATAQNATGIPDQLRNVYNRVASGERLAPGQRQDFLDRAKRLYRGQAILQGDREAEFKRIALSSGITPDNVVINFRTNIDDISLMTTSELLEHRRKLKNGSK